MMFLSDLIWFRILNDNNLSQWDEQIEKKTKPLHPREDAGREQRLDYNGFGFGKNNEGKYSRIKMGIADYGRTISFSQLSSSTRSHTSITH